MLELFNDLYNQDWQRPIMQDSHLPYVAMTLYLEKKISLKMLFTLLMYLEMKQVLKDKPIQCFNIVDQQGRLTQQFIDTILKYFSSINQNDPEDIKIIIQNIQLLIQQIPKSEQIYFKAGIGHYFQGYCWRNRDRVILQKKQKK